MTWNWKTVLATVVILYILGMVISFVLWSW